MTDQKFGRTRGLAALLALAGRYPHWLVPMVYAICAVAFVADLNRANTLAYGIFYIPLVATSVFHKHRYSVYALTALACLMIVIGAFFPVVDPDIPELISNRVLSILAILATATFVDHAHATQERLAAQTDRAEAAERMKSEVFANLSEEMRTPLHRLLGLLNLMMATCRPDQHEALGRVRDGSMQLLETINNLIDLTQIEEQALQPQSVDVATILRDAAASARCSADERRVAIELAEAPGDTTAKGDAWATRRILDNLIAHAIRFSRPGDTVSIAVRRDGSKITTSVSDAGAGLRPELPVQAGAGLTLSERLATAMNGQLTMTDRGGFGATVSLSLPAA